MVRPRCALGSWMRSWVLCWLVALASGVDTHMNPTNKVSDEGRKIPWAPRVVVERKEAAMFLAERDCAATWELAFSVHNFRLQQDGDVLYRFPSSVSGSVQLGRGVILCGKEGETSYGKPFFNCTLNMRFRSKWQSDMQHGGVPVLPHTAGVGVCDFLTEGGCIPSSTATVQTLIDMIPSGRPRMQARLFVSKLERIIPTAAWASSNGWRGPPTAVLTDGALWIKCRGPLSGDDCVEDRWALLPNETAPSASDGVPASPWLALDMGGLCRVSGLLLDWGTEYATDYHVEVSDDGVEWALVLREEGRTGARSDENSMHTVHAVDLRKGDQGGGGSSELVRPQGVLTRFVRVRMLRAEALEEGLSLWRVVVLGRRVPGQLPPHALRQDLVLYLADKSGNSLGISTKTSLVIIDPRPTSTFVYLVSGHTCRDLSNVVRTEGHVTIQLAWGEPCVQDKTALFLLNASRVEARNALIREVNARRIQYLYLVFVEDVDLTLTDGISEEGGDAWREFERQLLWWLPAVGFPHHPPSPKHEGAEVELAFDFNSASSTVVAYHHEAVPLLLPFITKFDNASWSCAGVIQNVLAAALFHRNRIQFNNLRVARAPTAVRQHSPRPTHALVPHRCTEAKAWIASAITNVDSVASVCWGEVCPDNFFTGIPERRTSSYGTAEEGRVYDPCHEYFRSKECLHADIGPGQCPGTDTSLEAAVTRLLSLIQQLHARTSASQSTGGRPYRVRSIIHGGRQVGIVASTLDELRDSARREFGGSGHVVVLCCGGDTEVTTEPFFQTLRVNEAIDVQFLGAWD